MHTLILIHSYSYSHTHTLILIHSYSGTGWESSDSAEHELVSSSSPDGSDQSPRGPLSPKYYNLWVSLTSSPFLPLSLSFRNPLTVSHSYPLSPVRHLPPLPPVSVCIDTDTAMPSSPVPTHALIRAHLPEGQRTIV